MENTPEAFIFFGRSGSGKGTQIQLLEEKLKEQGRNTLYIGTGSAFRELIEGESHTAVQARDYIHAGKLLPLFMPIWMWGGRLVNEFDGSQDLILDGAGRRLDEAKALQSALEFYGIGATVIHVNVSEEEVVRRMQLRGRADDQNEAQLRERLAWYERDVMPVIEYFDAAPAYRFVDINGEQSVEAVHEEIMSKLGLS